MASILRIALVAAMAVSTAEAIYFHVVEGQSRCFIEEVPAETLVLATYRNPDFIEFGRPEFTGTVRTTF
jgi:hypothetical protein